ncbi:hypothetical protein [Methylomicrobium lacus]|uniref:hypothetical protein n=1 Tax=Methylomicrobium lacus TaxID=136992 RepID=UPI0035A93798
MGYEVHITRKEEWFEEEGPEITIEEWKNYVVSDPKMRLDGFAEATTPDGSILRVESPGLSVWVAYSKHEEYGNMAWFDHYKDRITVKNPDEEILIKMHAIASALEAKVQGDEGEIYDSNGQSNWQELRGNTGSESVVAKKPWWKFWS